MVAERYNEIHYGMAPWQVEQLLGPPTERHASGPEINRAEESWWNGGRNYFPENRIWHRWSDSNDPDRWVAVAYTGFHTKRMVHLKIMRDL